MTNCDVELRLNLYNNYNSNSSNINSSGQFTNTNTTMRFSNVDLSHRTENSPEDIQDIEDDLKSQSKFSLDIEDYLKDVSIKSSCEEQQQISTSQNKSKDLLSSNLNPTHKNSKSYFVASTSTTLASINDNIASTSIQNNDQIYNQNHQYVNKNIQSSCTFNKKLNITEKSQNQIKQSEQNNIKYEDKKSQNLKFNNHKDKELKINNHNKKDCKFIATFFIQIENDFKFGVSKRIIGDNGINMKRIFNNVDKLFSTKFCKDNIVNKSQLKIRLRGRGSGYLEGENRIGKFMHNI